MNEDNYTNSTNKALNEESQEQWDASLQMMFANVEQKLPADQFVDELMLKIKPRRLNKFILALSVMLVLFGGWLLAPVLSGLDVGFIGWNSLPVIDLGDSALAFYFAPLNNPVALLTITLFGLWYFLRRLQSQ